MPLNDFLRETTVGPNFAKIFGGPTSDVSLTAIPARVVTEQSIETTTQLPIINQNRNFGVRFGGLKMNLWSGPCPPAVGSAAAVPSFYFYVPNPKPGVSPEPHTCALMPGPGATAVVSAVRKVTCGAILDLICTCYVITITHTYPAPFIRCWAPGGPFADVVADYPATPGAHFTVDTCMSCFGSSILESNEGASVDERDNVVLKAQNIEIDFDMLQSFSKIFQEAEKIKSEMMGFQPVPLGSAYSGINGCGCNG
ncbi:MAG: hypothetical protein NUW37_19395 [Planctomycetes bacterium]|nr:hypothetical protein [Planctomycetota bacterium]